MNISALILAKNEEDMIADCIKQLSFANEVIVLDQDSSDATVSISEKLGAKVYKSQNESFATNRNELKEKSSHEWILYMDTDERLTKSTVEEILEKIKDQNAAAAYYFPRKNIMLGKWLRHGGWWPDYTPRLFKKSKLSKWTGSVHESPTVDGSIAFAKNPITHLTARSVSRMLAKSVRWAKVEAELNYKANAHKVTKIKVLKAMVKEFTRRYVIKMGCMDGKIGLIQSIYQSLHAAMVLTYLWEIQNKSEEKINTSTNE